MYMNKQQVRDVVTKLRTSVIRDEKARVVANFYEKQKATYFHDVLAQVIDEEYEHIMNQKRKLKRVS